MKLPLIINISIYFIFTFQSISAQETWKEDSEWISERDSIIAEIDHIFSNLNKSKLNTGFIYDRVVLPVSGIENYNGTTDSLLGAKTWLQLHYELTRFATPNPDQFISTYRLDSIIRVKNNIVPIGIISLEYDKIKEEAIDSGWLYVQNNQLL